MNLIDTRTIYGIGSGECRIYTNGSVAADGAYEDGVGYVVEVANNFGTSRVDIDLHDEAWRTFMHPLDGKHDLEIPAEVTRPVSIAEHRLYVALETAEAGERDVA